MKGILRIIIVIILSITIVGIVGTRFDSLLRKHDRPDEDRLAEIFEGKTAYDMLFIGSSRTHLSINPGIIDSICGTNSFNAGVEGGMIPDFKMTIEGYLVNHPAPKVMVLTIDLPSFSNTVQIQKYPQYYPFLNNEAVNKALLKSGYGLYLIRAMPFLSITDQDDYTKEMIIQMLRGRDTSCRGDGMYEYKGYASNGEAYMKNPKPEKIIKRMKITGESVTDLQEIVHLCKEKRIKLIFTYAPEYDFNLQKSRTNIDSVFGMMYDVAQKNNIPIIRDDSLSICKSVQYFANNGHLNKNGASVYSTILAEELKGILFQNKHISP